MSARRQSSTSSLSRYAHPQDAELENRSIDFCNSFWGVNDPGVEVLFARMRHASKTVEDLRAFWRERAAIEDEYAKRLVKLSKQTLGQGEVGELKNSLEVVRLETERQAGQHLTLSISIKRELEGPAHDFVNKQANHRKTAQAAAEKSFRAKQMHETYVAKAKERYETDCHRINSYTAQQSMVQGRDLEKIIQKLERVQSTVETNQRDYQNYARALADAVGKWDKEWKNFCDTCQDLEEERLEFMKDNVWAYANAVSTVCVAEDESCETIRVALERLDVEKDIEFFVTQYGTGSAIPEAQPFINHTAAETAPLRPATRQANFARSSTRPQSIMARLPAPPPEEEPTDAGNAGVGAGAQIANGRRSRQGTINNGAPSQSPSSANYNSSVAQPLASPMPIGTSSHQQAGSIGNSSNLYSQPPPTSAPTSAYRGDLGKDPQALGGPNDPIAAQMAKLREGGASPTPRRGTIGRNSVEQHRPPSSAQGSLANRPVSPALSALAPKNYQADADAVVGAHPSTSRPSSPAVNIPPHAVMMQSNSLRSPSPVPVEAIVSNYQQSFPGERSPSRRNSFNNAPDQARGRTTERGGAPRGNSPGGYAGVGAQGRSPSPQPFRGASPATAPPSNFAPGPERRATSPAVGISLDPSGNVIQDRMADSYNRRATPAGYVPPAPAVPAPVPVPPPSQAYPTQQQQPPAPPSGYYAPPAPPNAQQYPSYSGVPSNPVPPPASMYNGYPVPAVPPPASNVNVYAAPGQQNGYAQSSPPNAYGNQQSQVPFNSYGGSHQVFSPPEMHPTSIPPPAAPSQSTAQTAQNRSSVPSGPSPAPPTVPSPAPPTGAYFDGKGILFYVKALYDYTATIEEEFDFQAGDVIAVLATPEDGWWQGILLDDSRRQPGRTVFPSNFVCLF